MTTEAPEPRKVAGSYLNRHIGEIMECVRYDKERIVVTSFGWAHVAIVPLEDLERLKQLDETRGER